MLGDDDMQNKVGQAGTLESNDIVITIAELSPGCGIEINLTSIVLKQFGVSIKNQLLELCHSMGITDIKIVAVDKGALECTIEARFNTAIKRAGIIKEG